MNYRFLILTFIILCSCSNRRHDLQQISKKLNGVWVSNSNDTVLIYTGQSQTTNLILEGIISYDFKLTEDGWWTNLHQPKLQIIIQNNAFIFKEISPFSDEEFEIITLENERLELSNKQIYRKIKTLE